MLTEWIVQEKQNQVFNIIPKGSWLGDDVNTDGGIFVQTGINKFKITNLKQKSKNRADWEKSIKEEKVRTEM